MKGRAIQRGGTKTFICRSSCRNGVDADVDSVCVCVWEPSTPVRQVTGALTPRCGLW